MALTVDGSPLVPGEGIPPDKMMRTIRAVRGFLYEGRAIAPGTVLTIPSRIAGELCAGNKAVRVNEVEVPVPAVPAPVPPPVIVVETPRPPSVVPFVGTVKVSSAVTVKRPRGRPRK